MLFREVNNLVLSPWLPFAVLQTFLFFQKGNGN